MRHSGMVLPIVGLFVAVGAFFTSNSAVRNVESSVDYKGIAANLVTRAQESTEGVVDYRHYRFRIPPSQFDELADMLAASHDVPQEGLADQVQSWLDGNLPPQREAWVGSCAFRTYAWRDQRERIAGVDTSFHDIEAMAVATGVQPAPLINRVVRHSDGVIETAIEEGLAVFIKSAGEMAHPVVPVDISLASWQDAIDLGANVAGQDIYGTNLGSVSSIIYVNSKDGGSFVGTTYSFDSELDWGPTSVHVADNGGTLMRILYGYSPAATGVAMRPCAVAQGRMRQDGDIDALVWIIERWEETCDPDLVEIILPAYYLEVDIMGGAGVPPITAVREPEYLVGVEPCDKVIVALVAVIQAFGTDDRSADYNYDGIVDAADINAVLERFTSGQ